MPGEPAREQKQTSTVNRPLAEAQPLINSIVNRLSDVPTDISPVEDWGLSQMEANARAGNRWEPQISRLTSDLFEGGPDRSGLVSDAYNAYLADLAPTARGDYLDPNKNLFFGQTTSRIADDTINRVNAMYAGAGRDPASAGSVPGQVAQEVTKAVAPVYADVYNRERGNQLNAQGARYAAANTTGGILSQFDQARFANRQAGIGAANAAIEVANDPYKRLLAIEAQRRGIPLDALQRISGMAVPIAGLGGTSQSSSTTTSTPAFNPVQTAIGGGLGLLGLMSGNPMMAMGAMRGAVGQPWNLLPRTPVAGLDEWYYANVGGRPRTG